MNKALVDDLWKLCRDAKGDSIEVPRGALLELLSEVGRVASSDLLDPFRPFKLIDPNMRWKDAGMSHIDQLQVMLLGLGRRYNVVGSHTSKSISLPVVRIEYDDAYVYVRDNFNDVNVCVVSKRPINVPLHELFGGILAPKDWAWYLGEVKRCRDYSWSDWSDEEMDNPESGATSPLKGSRHATSAEARGRWMRRMKDPAWYKADWAGHVLVWAGEFGPSAEIWLQQHAFLEGIDSFVPEEARGPYKPGCLGFSLALVNLDEAGTFIRRLKEKGGV